MIASEKVSVIQYTDIYIYIYNMHNNIRKLLAFYLAPRSSSRRRTFVTFLNRWKRNNDGYTGTVMLKGGFRTLLLLLLLLLLWNCYLCGSENGRIVFNIFNQFLFHKTSNYCLSIKGYINLLNFNYWPNFLIFSTRPDMLKTRKMSQKSNRWIVPRYCTYCIYECEVPHLYLPTIRTIVEYIIKQGDKLTLRHYIGRQMED